MRDFVVTVPIPVMSPFLWLALAGAAIFVVAWLVNTWPYTDLRKKLPVLHEKPMTNAFVWFAVLLFPVWLALLTLVLGGVYSLWSEELPDGTGQALAFRVHYLALVGLITALAGLVGAPLAIHRLYTVERQTKATEEGLITDRINKAVEGLGAEKTISRVHRTMSYFVDGTGYAVDHWYDDPAKPDVPEGAHDVEISEWETITQTLPNLEVRIGAIYALERIAQDSLRDHIQIMEILCAYVRENSPAIDLVPKEPPFTPDRPRTDIQVALDVIGRRPTASIKLENSAKYRLDLRGVDLSGANFLGGNFVGALFFNSRLEASNFRSTNLQAARLQGCLLNFADFFNANLLGAVIDRACINKLDGWGASITLAVDMRGLSMANADISAIRYLPDKETHSPTFGTKDTKLDSEIASRRSKREQDIEQFTFAINGIDIDDEVGVRHRLREAGFLYWSPYDASDGVTGSLRKKLWDDLGLIGFPYDD